MPLIPLGELTPDLSTVNNPGVTVATNVLPLGAGYKQFLGQNVVSDALDARARACCAHNDSTDTWYSYAGDAAKLYMLSGTTWSDASTGHTLGDEEGWEFTRWEDKIVAVSIGEVPEADTIGTGTFATFITSTLVPKAHHVGVVGNFLVMGDINDGAIKRNDVIWSALGDFTKFDASATTLAGQQSLHGEGGVVQKVIGGFQGTIFQQNHIWRMVFEGPPTIFRFDRVVDNIGAISKGGVVKQGDGIFFLSEDGFFLYSASTGQLRPIGKNRVDNTILGELDRTNMHRVSTAVDPVTGLIYFSYPVTDGDPTKMAIYNPFQDRWATAEFAHQLVCVDRGKGSGFIDSSPLSTRNIDTDSYLIDSAEFKGGVPAISVFDTSNQLAQLNGAVLKATFETGEVVSEDNRRVYVNRVRPLVTGANANIKCALGTRETLSDAITYTDSVMVNRRGESTVRASGTYMNARVEVEDGFDDALLVDIPFKAGGRK